MTRPRPHIFGIDDGPFEKHQTSPAAIVGVVMEGADLVESIAIGNFPVDGDGATDFLVDWISELRVHPSLQAVMLGGITLAGLGIVDIAALSTRTRCPVVVVNRRDPRHSRLPRALAAAGLEERLTILERTPVARRVGEGLFLAVAGATTAEAEAWVNASLRKARIPEPLRIAHMIARAITTGESRGRA